MSLSNAPKKSNVSENWLFDFTADNSNCLVFDGTDDYISFGKILGTYVNFTVEFWIRSNVVNDTKVILSLGADDSSSEAEATNTVIQVTRQNAEINCFYEYNNGDNESNVTSSFGLSANTWTHVAVVRSDADGQIHFYKNGVFVESETASNDPEGATDSNVNFRIGANE